MAVKMMKWRPFLSSKKFEVKIIVCCLHGLSTGEKIRDFSKLGVEVKWKGSIKSKLNFNRSGVKRSFTNEESVNDEGFVEWNEEFVGICDLVGFGDGLFHQWEVAFKVFDGLNQRSKRLDHTVATGSLNLAEFASAEQEKIPIKIHLSVPDSIECTPILSVSLSLQELRTPHDLIKDSPQRSILPFPLSSINKDKSKIKKFKIFKVISSNRAKIACREEESIDGKTTEGAGYPYDTDSLNESDHSLNDSEDLDYGDLNIKKSFSYGTLADANHVGILSYEDQIYYKNYNLKKDEDLNVFMIDDGSEKVVFKRMILPWRKRKLTFGTRKVKGEPLLKKNVGDGGDDIDFDRRMLSSSDDSTSGRHKSSEDSTTTSRSSFSEFGDDIFTVGKWENVELINRDNTMKLKTQVFFASIDQRSEKASGESACTTLVATIADWFHKNPDKMPVKSELDSLIHQGSLEWRNLCEIELFKTQFPDKHFDLETVLESSKSCDFYVVPEKSFVGFFHPTKRVGPDEGFFDFLDGSMSFDDIWDDISGRNNDVIVGPAVYIVSWNDHFFVLKVDRDAYYIIDTLGERLYEGCNQGYMLKFDQDTTIQRLTNQTMEKTKEVDSEEVVQRVFRGKESCKEYIKSFLASIPIRELEDDIKKGLVSKSSPLVQHRLQIEFHYTGCKRL